MSYRAIAELSLKILAFYWLLIAVNSMASNFIFFSSVAQMEKLDLLRTLLSVALQSVVPSLIAVILFFLVKPLSKYIAPSNTDDNSVILNIKPPELHFVLLSIFGFALITFSLIPITKQLIGIFSELSKTQTQLFTAKAILSAYLVQFFIGLWLALGSRGISTFIYKLRHSNR